MPDVTSGKEEPFDEVGFIMAFEGGELMEDQVVAGIQKLIDSGTIYSLQGFYGRTAADLQRRGFVHGFQ